MKDTSTSLADLPRRMTPSDALFWYAETALPIFRPIIAGLYVLDGHPKPGGIEAACDAVIDLVPRLRQRVVEAPLHLGLPEWEDDEHFDKEYHLRHVGVAAPGGMRDLLDLAATLLATPLDRERPLWEAYWIDGLEGGRSAFFLKMHHCVVDGVGSLRILNGLTQPSRNSRRRASVGRRRKAQQVSKDIASRLAAMAVDNARASADLALRAARAPLGWIRDPRGTTEEIGRLARGVRGVIEDASRPVVEDPLAKSCSGLSRRLDTMDIPIERLKAIKQPLGATINDVVLAALAGALGAYHRKHHASVKVLNCLVPMNLRNRDEKDNLGNRVGMINIALPVGEKSPRLRLKNIIAQTRAAKTDQRGALYPFLMQALTVVPGAAFKWLARNSLGRINVACTNVPGLPDTRYMAGAKVEAIYPFVSVVEGTPLGIALLSYDGRMDVGIDTDPEAIPDPHEISTLLGAALEELEALGQRRSLRAATASA